MVGRHHHFWLDKSEQETTSHYHSVLHSIRNEARPYIFNGKSCLLCGFFYSLLLRCQWTWRWGSFSCRTHEWQLYDNGEAFDVGRSFFYSGLVQWINMYIWSLRKEHGILMSIKSNRYESRAGNIYIIYVLKSRDVSFSTMRAFSCRRQGNHRPERVFKRC